MARMFIKRRAERGNRFLKLVGAGLPLAKEGECIAEIILCGCPEEGHLLARIFLESFPKGDHSLLKPNGADLPLPKGCERVTEIVVYGGPGEGLALAGPFLEGLCRSVAAQDL